MLEQLEVNRESASSYRELKKLPRRWFPLWTLDSYILREFLVKYGILLTVFIILFVLSDVYNDLSDFLDAGANWRVVALYLLYRLPGNIRFILPISTLLGCIWTMATFGKNLEVTAMRASGVSLFRCGGPILAFGVAVTLVNIYFNELLVPWTSEQAERVYDASSDKRRHATSVFAFRSQDGERRWLFRMLVSGNYRNVTIKTRWNDAWLARLLGRPGTPEYEAKLKNVLGLRFEQLPGIGDEKARSEAVRSLMIGRKLDLNIAAADYDERTREWVFEQGVFVSYDRYEETMFKASQGTMAMHPDIPFRELRVPEAEIPETPRDILNAVREKDSLSTPVIWSVLRRNPDMPRQVRCIYETIFYYRIAFPWSCFLAVFLGIPLATRNERTGSMLAIITAISLIVVYIVVAEIFLMLGKNDVLNPVLCGLAPTISFIAAGAWKLMNDRN